MKITRSRMQFFTLLTLIAGVAFSLLSFIAFRGSFFAGLLQGFGYWMAVWLGAIGLLILHQLTGGRWGDVLKPFLRQVALAFPVAWILFLPVIAGLSQLYPWVPRDGVPLAHLIESKAAYLNVPSFYFRAFLYLVLWTALALRLSKKEPMGKGVAGVSLLLYVISTSFATFDWFMSLEPEWFSSLYGGLFIVGSLVTILSLGILRLHYSSHTTKADALHDLGKLLMMAVMLWGYLNFSQYLIMWTANIPEEMTWYHHRGHGLWHTVGLILVVFHFFVPFLLLLSRQVKRQSHSLARVAALLLLMRFVDWTWWVQPAFQVSQLGGLISALGGTGIALGLASLMLLRGTPNEAPQDRPHARGGKR